MDEQFDHRSLASAPVARAPWYFRLGRYLSKRKIRGGDRLLSEARRRGLLDRFALYRLSEHVSLRVPLWRPCNEWDEDDVRTYEWEFIQVLANAAAELPGDVTVIDCGADIGTVSAHLVARCNKVTSIIAFEPNPAAFSVLLQNLAGLGVEIQARNVAAGDFSGKGTLVSPTEDQSAHAMFVRASQDGTITVERVDDLGLSPTPCVLKIDVEGTEAAVIEGATRTIRESPGILVAFEAHPRVWKRTKVDPIEIMQALLEIRSDFTFDVDTTPARSVSPTIPFFEQVPPTRNYNVVARSCRST